MSEYFGIPVGDQEIPSTTLKPFSYGGVVTVPQSITLDSTYSGKVIIISAPNVVVTLPLTSTTPGYVALNVIYAATTGTSSVVTQGSDSILSQTAAVSTIVFNSGDSIELVSNLSGQWVNVSSSTQSISQALQNNTDPNKGAALIGYYPNTNVKTALDTLNTNVSTNTSSISNLNTEVAGVINGINNLNNARTKYNISATSNGQTTFTVPNGYTVGRIEVYIYNTYLVESVDYTATDGSTIVLINRKIYNTVQIGDVLTVSALSVFTSLVNPVDSVSLSSSGGANLVGYGAQTVKSALDQLNLVRTKISIPASSAQQTVFTIPGGYIVGRLEAFLHNQYLMEGVDYTATNGSTLTIINTNISNTIVSGDPLVVSTLMVYAEGQHNVDSTSLASSGGATLVGYGTITVKQALDQTIVNRQQQYYTGLTTNTIPVTGGYTPGAIEVYKNGSKIPFGSNQYQATDGQNVVFQTNLISTDVVELLINSAFSYNNGVIASQLSSSQAGLGASLVGYHQGGTVSQALDALLNQPVFYQGVTTSANQTTLPVSSGYTVGTIRAVTTGLGLTLLHSDFTATDGQNIVITNSNINLPNGTAYQVETYTPYVVLTTSIQNDVALAQAAALAAQTALPPTSVTNYTTFRSYNGTATNLFVTGYSGSASPSNITGWFTLDPTDTTTADNSGTCIVDALNRRWKRNAVTPLNLKDFGAKGDGVTNDDVAINAWLSALKTGMCGYVPAGTYLYTTAKIAPLVSNVTIRGDGARVSKLIYNGSSTNIDLFSVGDGTNSYTGWKFEGLCFDSYTKMTAGAALRIKRMQAGSLFVDIDFGSTTTSPNLYHGMWFDNVNVLKYNYFNITVQADGIRINGSATNDEGSDVYLDNGVISFCNIGLHIGGGQGGIYVAKVLGFGNGTNFQIDNGIISRKNREFFFSDQCISDGCINYGFYINDTLTAGAPISLNAAIGSAGLIGTGGVGINVYVKSWSGSRITMGPGQLYNATSHGMQVDDATTLITISSARQIVYNSGWGIYASVSTSNIVFDGYASNNTLGNFSPNSNVGVWTSYVPPPSSITAGSGTLGSATASFRYKTRGKTNEWTGSIQIISNGTGGTSINVPMPFVSNSYFISVGRENAVLGKGLQGFMSPGSNNLSITNMDNTYPAATGYVLLISGITEAQ